MTFIFREEFDQLRNDFIVQVTDGNIGIYFSNLGAKGDLVFELNDDRINKSILDILVVTGGFEGSGNIHVRGVQNMSTFSTDPEFCIEVESSPEECNSTDRTGNNIYLSHNNLEKATIPQNFEYFKFCLPVSYVDTENDKFKLHIRGKDGVSKKFEI